MYQTHEKYINTATDGQVVVYDHGLKTARPFPFLTEPANLSDFKAVSLYDSRIVDIIFQGDSVVEISFNGPFEGYLTLLNVKNTRNTVDDRVLVLENLIESTIEQQKQLVTASQWQQMNNYNDVQHADMSELITQLDSDLSLLEARIDSF